MRRLKSLALTTALAGGLFASADALAQSTGSQTVEQVVVTSKRPSLDGLGTVIKAAKDQSIVSAEYLTHEVGSNNFAQSINLLPGVSYSTEDPTGILSSDFRMHGFDGNHVSITVDGTPVNDTGNYAMYPGEYLVAEAMDKITVNMGQTEVDSPTASALGGTVNIISKRPSATPSVSANASAGSYDFRRAYAEVDTGAVGPTGLRSYLSFNWADANKYKGRGEIKRWGFDGQVYQPLSGTDFLSVAFTYASDRPIFYYSGSLAQYAQYGQKFDYNTQWVVPTVVAGKADGVATGTGGGLTYAAGNDSNYYALHPNPVDFGDIRGQSRFAIGKQATLTVDPYFFYTIANGGGTTNLSESDPRLIGSATAPTCAGGGKGVDLNGDGDCLDTVLVYSPSNTQTYRYGVNSSLIYDFNDHNTFQASYTWDYGRHRQTGEFTTINQQTGQPADVFGAKPGYGAPIAALDNTSLRKRDRFSIAELNQISLNYVGKFLDDKLHVNIGVRNPHFERDLHDFCYDYNGGSYWCDSVATSAVATALAADNATLGAPGATAANLTKLLGTTVKYGANGLANFRLPFKQTYHYDKVLPNAGAWYQIDDNNQVYATVAEGFSAPKTDDLYVSSPETVQPETSMNYGVGYRLTQPTFTLSTNLWATTWKNHIISTVDPTDPTLSIDRNVGSVNLYGLDSELAWKVTPELSLYTSLTLMHSELQDNYAAVVTAGPDKGKTAFLPVKGKELVLTPDQEFAERAEYKLGDVLFGLEGKYVGKRYISDTNDASIAGKFIANLDVRYNIHNFGKDTYVQFNVENLFNERSWSRTTTVSTVNNVTLPNGDVLGGSTAFYYSGAPITAYIKLASKF